MTASANGLHLFNTLVRQEERFEPMDASNVRMYVCGPTVYDFAHIGNARPAVVFDVLFRLLRHDYGQQQVTYARNITDVDDKIIERFRESGEAIESITARTTQAYHDDMSALGVLPPDIEPRATQHIAEMIAIIEELIGKGHAYPDGAGHVLFDVPSMADYGQLSNRKLDEMVAGARVEVANYKKNPQDFVLWKPAKEDEPGWDSPWGKGRPGWHIECSAMSAKHLGEVFDIHGGGLDLIFPHHENEIAQSRCAHGTDAMARYWVHNGYVVVNGEKMSKSLGNFFTVRELLEEGLNGEAIRLALLSGHYRSPLDITREKIAESKSQLDRLYGALRGGEVAGEQSVSPEVLAALHSDLNTPLAVSHLHDLAGQINKADEADKAALQSSLKAGAALLGLLEKDAEAWFQGEAAGGDGAEIDALVAERADAKKAKNFARADEIRDQLAAQGIVLEDGPGGTTWRKA
ncbi:cysteine--tRNA ligase [Rhodovibrionaceae bacterium A322]